MEQEKSFTKIETHENFAKYSKIIGKGAFKTVFYGINLEQGNEIAWNEIDLGRISEQDYKKLKKEIEILKIIKNSQIIRLLGYWLDSNNEKLIFITEMMQSGSLRNYIDKFKQISVRAIKKFSYQILQGIDYLHSLDPPIIHRDIKCDNIFFNGSDGSIKIGDLGESTILNNGYAKSVIGTPQFMAPELYDEKYTEKVDIYAFGMSVLEMATGDYPYCECENPAQIFKKVTSGIPPKSLNKIANQEIQDFVKLCLLPENERPSANQLLNHPFFASLNVSQNQFSTTNGNFEDNSTDEQISNQILETIKENEKNQELIKIEEFIKIEQIIQNEVEQKNEEVPKIQKNLKQFIKPRHAVSLQEKKERMKKLKIMIQKEYLKDDFSKTSENLKDLLNQKEEKIVVSRKNRRFSISAIKDKGTNRKNDSPNFLTPMTSVILESEENQKNSNSFQSSLLEFPFSSQNENCALDIEIQKKRQTKLTNAIKKFDLKSNFSPNQELVPMSLVVSNKLKESPNSTFF
ncbi:wnk kinase isoform m [Anaeramoeba ignava]|uniref:Wnk kinase isoform m n=1 Tax=Anaeramoeba ignava TaxID=1746090 RepID=A0A9Q0LPU0_ANAIG|nr:wnk kinase isoform m [Anaeramoeba ignava]